MPPPAVTRPAAPTTPLAEDPAFQAFKSMEGKDFVPLKPPSPAEIAEREKAAAQTRSERSAARSLTTAVELPTPPDPFEVAITHDLVAQLCAELGMTPPSPLRTVTIEVPGLPAFIFEHRTSTTFADWTWATGQVATLQERAKGVIDPKARIGQVVDALLYCRCVVKMNGKYVWDRLGYRDSIIDNAPPGWNNDYTTVPSDVAGEIAWALFIQLAKLDSDIIDKLGDSVSGKLPPPADEKPAADENPTPAT